MRSSRSVASEPRSVGNDWHDDWPIGVRVSREDPRLHAAHWCGWRSRGIPRTSSYPLVGRNSGSGAAAAACLPRCGRKPTHGAAHGSYRNDLTRSLSGAARAALGRSLTAPQRFFLCGRSARCDRSPDRAVRSMEARRRGASHGRASRYRQAARAQTLLGVGELRASHQVVRRVQRSPRSRLAASREAPGGRAALLEGQGAGPPGGGPAPSNARQHRRPRFVRVVQSQRCVTPLMRRTSQQTLRSRRQVRRPPLHQRSACSLTRASGASRPGHEGQGTWPGVLA
jgi:hypothetical protein